MARRGGSAVVRRAVGRMDAERGRGRHGRAGRASGGAHRDRPSWRARSGQAGLQHRRVAGREAVDGGEFSRADGWLDGGRKHRRSAGGLAGEVLGSYLVYLVLAAGRPSASMQEDAHQRSGASLVGGAAAARS